MRGFRTPQVHSLSPYGHPHDVRYDAPAGPMLTDVVVPIADLTPGRWCLGVWDTWSGGFTRLAVVTARPGAALTLPPFTRDVAVWMLRC